MSLLAIHQERRQRVNTNPRRMKAEGGQDIALTYSGRETPLSCRGKGQMESQRKGKVPQSHLLNLEARCCGMNLLDFLTPFEEPRLT